MENLKHHDKRALRQEYRTDKKEARIEKKYAKYANVEAYKYALDASSAQAEFHRAKESEFATKEHIRAVQKASDVAHK